MSRRVLITGANGALGASVVQRFLAAGDEVTAVGGPAAGAAAAAGSALTGLEVRHADLTVSSEVDALFASFRVDGGSGATGATGATGGLAAVAHVAGGFRYGRLRDLSDDDWTFLLRVNLETTFRVARACARAFEAAGGGALVVVASPAGLLGEAGVGAYAATKAGALRLVESAAREMAAFGGRANAVLPGTMDTPANRRDMPAADRSRWVSTAAVAEVVYYLTTAAAAAVNGASVAVPGPGL